MKIYYEWDDLRQAILGSLAGVFAIYFFFVFRTSTDEIVSINPIIGLFMIFIFLFFAYLSLVKYLGKKAAVTHLLIDYIVSQLILIFVSLVFKLTAWDMIISFNIFGQIPFIGVIPVFISALVFDIKDVDVFLDRWTYMTNGSTHSPKNGVMYCKSKFSSQEEINNCMQHRSLLDNP